ncbi:MAG TPA: hypothetical protein VMN57_04360 [Anaerolineales bacterium]|nr:hypothetical protein [Anaerolineales bacterium]
MSERLAFKSLAVTMSLFGFGLIGWALYVLGNPSVVIRWSTATEFETAGYAIYRGLSPDGPFERISSAFIPASSDPISGGDYEFIDGDVSPGVTYFYLLEEIELSGVTNRVGPVPSTAVRRGVVEGALGSLLCLFSIYAIRLGPRSLGKQSE